MRHPIQPTTSLQIVPSPSWTRPKYFQTSERVRFSVSVTIQACPFFKQVSTTSLGMDTCSGDFLTGSEFIFSGFWSRRGLGDSGMLSIVAEGWFGMRSKNIGHVFNNAENYAVKNITLGRQCTGCSLEDVIFQFEIYMSIKVPVFGVEWT